MSQDEALRIDDPAFLALLERFPMPAVTVDYDGIVRFVNARATLEGGYRREDVPTLTAWRERAFPDLAYRAAISQRWDAAVMRAAQGGGDIAPLEIRLRTRAGEFREATIFGFVLRGGILALFIDETARRSAEAGRLLSEQRFRDVLDSAGEYVWECGVDYRYTFLSDKARDVFGYEPAEMLGHTPAQFMAAGEIERVSEQMQMLRDPNGAFNGLEHRSVRRNGEEFWQTVNGVAVRDAQGRIVAYRGTGRDITARKRAAEERERLELQVREAQKMQALGTLAGGVAHEFNNLLAVILGHTALARAEPGLTAAGRDSLAAIEDAARDARNLVSQLLAVGRQQPRSVAHVPLVPLVAECLPLFEASLPEGVALRYEAQADAPAVACDPAQIRQVVLNLGLNALHAMRGRSGEVRVLLGEALLDGQRVATQPPLQLPPGRYARLELIDQGCGMDDATRARIFEPFFTTKPVGQGTGLGLSVVDGIVRGHGGAVQVQSEPDRGSRVVVYLPIATDVAAARPGPAPDRN